MLRLLCAPWQPKQRLHACMRISLGLTCSAAAPPHLWSRPPEELIEAVLDLIASIDELPKNYRDNVANNYRALLTALEEFGVQLGYEYVYDVCVACHLVYRYPHIDPEQPRAVTHCPRPGCGCPRYDSNGKARRQFVYRSISDIIKAMFRVAQLARAARYVVLQWGSSSVLQ
jgi:hypothetical protein